MMLNRPKNQIEANLPSIKASLSAHQYEYKNPVGQGGFASVHLIKSIKYNQDFVVKLIANNSGDVTASAESEIKTLINLANPNVIQLYEYWQDQNYLYIVLEYCPGGSCVDLIKKQGPIKPPQLYIICNRLIKALKLCHETNIAHRDIKPANILIDSWGRPKLADFGLSQTYENRYEEKSFAGSKAYMSPELFLHTAYDPFAADIWALGVTFFYLATGRLPWNTSILKEMEMSITMGMINFPKNQSLDPKFIGIIREMIQVRPNHRASLEWLLEQEILNPQQVPQSQSSKSQGFPSISRTSSRLNIFSQFTTSAPSDEDNKPKGRIPACGSNSNFIYQSLSLKPILEKASEGALPAPTGRIPRITSCASISTLGTKRNARFLKAVSKSPVIHTFQEDEV